MFNSIYNLRPDVLVHLPLSTNALRTKHLRKQVRLHTRTIRNIPYIKWEKHTARNPWKFVRESRYKFCFLFHLYKFSFREEYRCFHFILFYLRRHGYLVEGIYRHSGVKTKIDRLLEQFRSNAWAVEPSREEFSEHDVANTLKRFMRTLDEPLLTEELRPQWMAASKIVDPEEKMKRWAREKKYFYFEN